MASSSALTRNVPKIEQKTPRVAMPMGTVILSMALPAPAKAAAPRAIVATIEPT